MFMLGIYTTVFLAALDYLLDEKIKSKLFIWLNGESKWRTFYNKLPVPNNFFHFCGPARVKLTQVEL